LVGPVTPYVTPSDTAVLAIVAAVAVVPLAAVALVALLRGYSIQLNMRRPRRGRGERRGRGFGDED